MPSYKDTLKPGDRVSSFEITDVLGHGGFAVTYLARDLHLEIDVAIKEYLPAEIIRRDQHGDVLPAQDEHYEDYENGLASFSREARTLARFKHPNIVRVHQVLHANQTAYMVMDYEHGEEFAELLASHRAQGSTLPESELRDILLPIMDAVGEIHAHGFVHRDIKPSNIYLRDQGTPVLLDFGAARFAMSENTQHLTAVVTVGYTPIEQYNVSDADQGPWSDIYALCAVLYEAVSGRMPVDSITRATALQVKQDKDPLVSVHQVAQLGYSPALLDAIDQGLQFSPGQRPQSMAALHHILEGNGESRQYGESTVLGRQYRAATEPNRVNPPGTAATAQAAIAIPIDKNTHEIRHLLRRDIVRRGDADSTRDQSGSRDAYQQPRSKQSQRQQARGQRAGQEIELDTSLASEDHLDHFVLRPELTDRDSSAVDKRAGSAPMSNAGRIAAPGSSLADSLADSLAEDDPARKWYRGGPAAAPTTPDTLTPRDFENTGWDLPRTQRFPLLRVLLPALGLAAIVYGSLNFVNRDTKATFNRHDSTDAAVIASYSLTEAKARVDAGDLVYPAGRSAADQYLQILRDQPANPEAQRGVKRIEKQLAERVRELMLSKDQSAANKLLARAADVGLNIDVPTVNASIVGNTEQSKYTYRDKKATAIDLQPSPWVKTRIRRIETLLDEGNTEQAQTTFNQVEDYIGDADTLAKLRQRLAAADTTPIADSVTPAIPAATTGDNIKTTVALSPAGTTQTPARTSRPAPSKQADTRNAPPPPQGRTLAAGALGNHLDELRVAIQSKDINAVLAQGTISKDRETFLRGMFERHDHLAVTIDKVENRQNSATAKLNVAMYNRRSDGSYYSAGRWSGVTLDVKRDANRWQSVRW